MPALVHLVHRLLPDGFHVYTSPDVDGVHASAATMADAQRAAIEILDFLAARTGAEKPAVTFTSADERLAA